MSLASHQRRTGTVTWLTPPDWISALGPFDLDPCCPPVMPWPTAARMFTEAQDGLQQPWDGRVWLNPPFGRQAHLWVAKLAAHGNGIGLTHACTETDMFYESVWDRANAVCFPRGRPHFYYEDGKRAAFNSGAAIALFAYGAENVEALQRANLGIVIVLRSPSTTKWTYDPADGCLYSGNFELDATLELTGDFATGSAKTAYATEILRKLNASPSEADPLYTTRMENDLLAIAETVQPRPHQDGMDYAMIVSSIRRIFEADGDFYINLAAKVRGRTAPEESK